MPNASPPWRVGVDTGGTFTDLVLVDGDGVIRATHKLLSTPDDPGRAVLEGIAKLLGADGVSSATLATPPAVVHGSTVATNALLEGKGADAALVTTAGFEDVLTIARQNRPDLYATVPRRPPPPIRRAMTLGADERTAFDGSVITPLDPHTLDALTQQLARLNPESVAVCLLHSYANPEHEQQIAQAIRDKLPGVHLTLSHELLPELREYERAATCAANVVVGPTMSRYLTRLDRELDGHHLRIMGSGGGTLPVGFVCDRPIETVTSGPAGGAIGAWAMARAASIDRVIGFDMGGTSTDVTLIDGGPTRTTHTTIAGLPIRLPMIDIHTVGAGGGSIAHIDVGGAMRVGPESAGALPGPACYDRQRPDQPLATVTDAHAVLGHLPDGRRLGDSLVIRRDAAVHAVRDLAQHASLSDEETALGVLRIADVAMARAVQQISVQRGYDLRRFTLLAFGGAGGLHACRLAEVLGMTRVLIPRHGGLLSAVGMLAAPPRYSFSHAAIATLTADASGRYPDPLGLPAVQHATETLRRRGQDALERDGVHETEQHLGLFLDMRYAGQSHELSIPLGPGDIAELFQQEHERLYGYAPTGRDIETVTARIEATGPAPEVRSATGEQAGIAQRPCQRTVPVTDRDGVTNWPCVQREALMPGQKHTGPMLIEEYAATTVVPRGWNLEVLADGQLSVTR